MEACRLLLEDNQLRIAIISGLYAADKIVEYWLGKTDKVEAASVLELILSPFLKKRSTEDQKQ